MKAEADLTQQALKPARPRTLADIDPTDEQQLAEWEARTLEEGFARVLEESDRLRKLGIIDEKGQLVTDELPADMRPDSKTDVTTL
jgi:hypothetical protein